MKDEDIKYPQGEWYERTINSFEKDFSRMVLCTNNPSHKYCSVRPLHLKFGDARPLLTMSSKVVGAKAGLKFDGLSICQITFTFPERKRGSQRISTVKSSRTYFLTRSEYNSRLIGEFRK
jgi:hypothetical protein